MHHRNPIQPQYGVEAAGKLHGRCSQVRIIAFGELRALQFCICRHGVPHQGETASLRTGQWPGAETSSTFLVYQHQKEIMLHTIPLPVMNPNIQVRMHVCVCVYEHVYVCLCGVVFIYFYIFLNFTLSEDSENEHSKGFSFLNKFNLKDKK